jgi:hypothetical protein
MVTKWPGLDSIHRESFVQHKETSATSWGSGRTVNGPRRTLCRFHPGVFYDAEEHLVSQDLWRLRYQDLGASVRAASFAPRGRSSRIIRLHPG